MTRTQTFAGFGLAAAALATPAFAQDAPPAVNTGSLKWEAGADIVSTYMFRGIEQEDSGLIFQPFVQVTAPIEIAGTSVDFTLGIWNSIHSVGTGAVAGGPSNWYESDLYASLSYVINDQFTAAVKFTGYYSPSNAFADVEELAFELNYDDTEVFGDWAFAPYVLVAFETRDQGGTHDIYLEIGGAFGAPFIESEKLPVELTFPFVLGLSLNDYYTDATGDNEIFGFLKIGVLAEMPLDFIPSDYGTWTAQAGLDLYFVNDDAGLLDDGDDFEIVAKVGARIEY